LGAEIDRRPPTADRQPPAARIDSFEVIIDR